MILEIKNLTVNIGDKRIINDLNLCVRKKEVHIIMGPNGAGKSTVAHILAGKDGYDIKNGTVNFNNENLLSLSVEERARKGLFLAFQYPVPIPGVSVMSFIKSAIKANRLGKDLDYLDTIDLILSIKREAQRVGLDSSLLDRQLNSELSGGEKKRIEALQLLMLEPILAVLDETDSGLDVDALKMLGDVIAFALQTFETGFLVITHYTQLLKYINPDYVHVLCDGKIVKSGDITLARYIENKGYENIARCHI